MQYLAINPQFLRRNHEFILEIMRFPSGKNFRGASLPRIYSVSPYDQSNSNGLKDYSKINTNIPLIERFS